MEQMDKAEFRLQGWLILFQFIVFIGVENLKLSMRKFNDSFGLWTSECYYIIRMNRLIVIKSLTVTGQCSVKIEGVVHCKAVTCRVKLFIVLIYIYLYIKQVSK